MKVLRQEGFGIFGVEGDVGLEPLLDDSQLRGARIDVDHFGRVGFMSGSELENGELLADCFYTTIRAVVG